MKRLALAWLLSPVLLAQTPSPAAALEQLVPLHTAPDDPDGAAYGIWAAGRGYKASFHNGFEFVPLVGQAPRRETSVRWRTRSCRIGASELLDEAAMPAPRWSATRCEYDHGAVIEAYDLHEEGVEQTFVLQERPVAHGDLVVHGELIGLRCGEASADDGSLTLCADDGTVLATYGRAIAIAADGATQAMQRTCDGNRVTLTLDAEWLQRAAWPIVVDPLLRPNLALGFSRRVIDVDVFRDDFEFNHEIWIASTIEDAASGDRDLLVHRLQGDFSDPREVFRDITTNWRTDSACLAGVGGSNKVVVVFARLLGSGSVVRWHLHDKGSLAVSTLVAGVNRPSGTHDTHPDVGGSDAFAAGRNALLVWQRDIAPVPTNTNQSRVLLATIDTTVGSQGSLSTPVPVDSSNNGDDATPSVNQEAEGGATFSWVVAWLRTEDNPFLRPRVAVRRVNSLGVLTTARLDVPTGFPLSAQGPPQIAGQDGRYLCIYGMRGSTGFHELVSARIDWPHNQALGTLPHGATSIEADNQLRMRVHGIAFDTSSRCHWLVTRRDEEFEQLRVLKLGARGRIVELEDLPIQGDRLPLGSSVAFDDDEDRFVIAVAMQPLLSTQAGAVQFDVMHYAPVAPVAQYGTGCATARLGWFGSQHIGDEFTRVSLLQGLPSRLVFITLALQPSNVALTSLGMPGCFLLADPNGPTGIGFAIGTSDAGGRFDLPLPLPEGFVPLPLHFQAFQFAPGANAAGVLATRGLAVEIGH